jgi:hypothetical protein
VTGLDKHKVRIAQSHLCAFRLKEDGTTYGFPLSHRLGREADVVVGLYKMALAKLPSGATSRDAAYPNTIPPPRTAAARAVLDDQLRFTPQGVVAIDPRTVVSNLPARRYDVLPGHAGLAQLVDRGVLEVSFSRSVTLGGTQFVGNIEIKGVDPKSLEVSLAPSGYRIIGPMTFPAGMHGSHSVDFSLATGVPYPAGDLGHSNLVCDVGEVVPRAGEICK